jgi:hypothetical protein
MEYTLTTPSGRTLATVRGYPEAVLTARALAHVEPVAIDGVTFRTVGEWDATIDALRALVATR